MEKKKVDRPVVIMAISCIAPPIVLAIIAKDMAFTISAVISAIAGIIVVAMCHIYEEKEIGSRMLLFVNGFSRNYLVWGAIMALVLILVALPQPQESAADSRSLSRVFPFVVIFWSILYTTIDHQRETKNK